MENRKNVYCIVSIDILFAILFLVSCASTPNRRALEDGATDVTNYSDFKVENCTLPDGDKMRMTNPIIKDGEYKSFYYCALL